jgi:hypothetical protein
MHLRTPNATGPAKQFQSTRAASCCPPEFVAVSYLSNRDTGRARGTGCSVTSPCQARRPAVSTA